MDEAVATLREKGVRLLAGRSPAVHASGRAALQYLLSPWGHRGDLSELT